MFVVLLLIVVATGPAEAPSPIYSPQRERNGCHTLPRTGIYHCHGDGRTSRSRFKPVGALATGKRADLLVLDSEHPNLAAIAPEDVLGTFVFCGNDNLVNDVMVGGRWVVRAKRHVAQDAIAQRYRQTIAQLRTLRS